MNKFYKYKICSASGHGEYDYVDLTWYKNPIKYYFEQLENEHSWSDKFRGIRYYKISKPPIKWIEKQLEYAKYQIKYNKELIEKYKKLKENT